MPGKQWTEGERKQLAEHYSCISAKELTKLLDRSACAIERRAFKDGLSKSHDRLREMGKENVLIRWNKAKQCVFTEPPSPSA